MVRTYFWEEAVYKSIPSQRKWVEGSVPQPWKDYIGILFRMRAANGSLQIKILSPLLSILTGT